MTCPSRRFLTFIQTSKQTDCSNVFLTNDFHRLLFGSQACRFCVAVGFSSSWISGVLCINIVTVSTLSAEIYNYADEDLINILL